MKRVLFLIPNLNSGGSQRVLLTILSHIDRSKFEIMLAVFHADTKAFQHLVPNDIEFVDLKSYRVRYGLGKIVALIWKWRPDAVFSTLSHLNLAIAALKPILPCNIKYIARESTILNQLVKKKNRPYFWYWVYASFYRNFHLIICQSLFMQRDLTSEFKISKKDTLVINNPIDFDYINTKARVGSATNRLFKGKRSSSTKFLAVGRLSAVKGFDILIEALSLIPSRDFSLTIIGDGELQSELRELSFKLGIDDLVFFEGFQSNPYPWYLNADALILSSHYEGFPNVVLESLACNTPVISTPAIGGVTEILRNVKGCVLAKEVSAVSLADAIVEWLTTRGKIDFEATVNPYHVCKIIGQYEDAINRILNID